MKINALKKERRLNPDAFTMKYPKPYMHIGIMVLVITIVLTFVMVFDGIDTGRIERVLFLLLIPICLYCMAAAIIVTTSVTAITVADEMLVFHRVFGWKRTQSVSKKDNLFVSI